MDTVKKHNRWLLPTLLILFILVIITLPLMMFLTYAGRAESPSHLITFANEKLTWDENTVVHDDGVAELSFFSQYYQNVNSENEDNVFAPGTDQLTTIRLLNNSSDTIKYTAVAYMIKECETLPLYGRMDAPGSSSTNSYPLPEGVTEADVLNAVTGTVDGKNIKDFDISWYWVFESGEEIEPGIYESDPNDTYLGNKAAWDVADDAIIGFYIVVEGDNGPIPPGPHPPTTGGASMFGWGIALIAISGIMLFIAVIDRLKEKKDEKKAREAQA